MPLAEEIQEVRLGCYTWQAFCPKAKVELNSHALVRAGKLFLIDPIGLTKEALDQLGELGAKPAAVFLTNSNHERAAGFFQKQYGIPVHADPMGAAELTIETTAFPRDIADLEIIPLPGAGLGEVGIYDRQAKLLVVGDIIINLDSYEFAPLPDKYATDPKEMRRSLQTLAGLDVYLICFAHGLPMISAANERLRAIADQI